MDLAYLLIIDAILLMGATIILTYYFLKDMVKKKNEDQWVLSKGEAEKHDEGNNDGNAN